MNGLQKIRRLLLAAGVSAALVVPGGAVARGETQSFQGDYAVTYLGLTVARSRMKSTLEGKSYSIQGSVSSAGLGAVFDDTKATIEVSGSLAKDGAVPSRAHTDYKQNRKSKQLTITFAKGDVVKTEEVPPPKPRGADWIPVTAGQLRDVVDPLSAFLVSADSLDAVCSKSLKLYDGEMRVDLQLQKKDISTVELAGYEGPAVTCKARFVPVSGYRSGKKSVKFMRDKARILITFAPLGTTGVYAPVRASVGTEIGTLTLQARRVEIVD